MSKPIAIVGLACRFPGGIQNLDDFWKLLLNGRDVAAEIPTERFATACHPHPSTPEPGKKPSFAAGGVDNAMDFDADFFAISPREAAHMDPQLRLLLELTWETFENAGIAPRRMAARRCAVYVGISRHGPGDRSINDAGRMDAYYQTGVNANAAANRISHQFDLRGPSRSIDTADSSSLVALHQACVTLQAGKAELALAGGVHLLPHPPPLNACKTSTLSSTGRCRPVDAAGDGYVPAEGAGLVLLKPLDAALRDGHAIHAVIAGSGINLDGHIQGDAAAPTVSRQAELLDQTYAQAGADPADLAYVEAHGIDTAASDSIEACALSTVLGRRRPADRPLPIGSVKGNIGHLEAASGMAGLLKAILSLKYRILPPSIHYRQPNPSIDFAHDGLRVVTQVEPLDALAQTPMIGINAFGLGGTHAHVLLQAAPARVPAPAPATPVGQLLPLLLSARSETALRTLAAAYLARLQAGMDWNQLAAATAHQRQWLDHRVLITPSSHQDGCISLQRLVANESSPTLVKGKAADERGKLALVFSGNGSQWANMGQRLLVEEPIFRQAFEQIDALWREDGSPSLLAAMRQGVDAEWLAATEHAQPLLFAMQVAMVEVLNQQGLQYDACTGHSVGEVAAAWACGALSLPQAVHVIKHRSFAQGPVRGIGRMAAAGIDARAARQLIEDLNLATDLTIAGINSPQNVTLAGSLAGLLQCGQVLQTKGVFFQLLDLDYAFHNHRMDPIREPVLSRLGDLELQSTHTPFISTVTGEVLAGTALDAEYWWRNVRRPVRFEAALRTMIGDGIRLFVEVGPHSILRTYISQTLAAEHTTGRALPLLKRNHDQAAALHHALALILVAGARIDPAKRYPMPSANLAAQLPTYPWQRKRQGLPASVETH